MAPQDPPPAPPPPTKRTPDRIAAVLGNATLLGIGYLLLRRPRPALVSLAGSALLLTLLALYPHVLVWRLLLPLWWALLVVHTWRTAARRAGEPAPARRGWNPVWRDRVLASLCLVCVLFGWLRFDTWTVVREAEAAHSSGDCTRAQASLRWLGPPHHLAHGSLASRGEEQRETCALLVSALAASERTEAARDLDAYLDRSDALWDGAGPGAPNSCSRRSGTTPQTWTTSGARKEAGRSPREAGTRRRPCWRTPSRSCPRRSRTPRARASAWNRSWSPSWPSWTR